jgi:hypothetical protein
MEELCPFQAIQIMSNLTTADTNKRRMQAHLKFFLAHIDELTNAESCHTACIAIASLSDLHPNAVEMARDVACLDALILIARGCCGLIQSRIEAWTTLVNLTMPETSYFLICHAGMQTLLTQALLLSPVEHIRVCAGAILSNAASHPSVATKLLENPHFLEAVTKAVDNESSPHPKYFLCRLIESVFPLTYQHYQRSALIQSLLKLVDNFSCQLSCMTALRTFLQLSHSAGSELISHPSLLSVVLSVMMNDASEECCQEAQKLLSSLASNSSNARLMIQSSGFAQTLQLTLRHGNDTVHQEHARQIMQEIVAVTSETFIDWSLVGNESNPLVK